MKKHILLASIIVVLIALSLSGQRDRYSGEPSVVRAGTDIYFGTKTVVKTISVDDDASVDDFQFDDDVANTAEQPIDFGALIPAYAEIVSAQIRCFETVNGSGDKTMGLELGISTGSNEILSTANTDTANDINVTAATAGPELAATNAARNIWLSATPTANWSSLTAGRWVVIVTYIDYGAVYTAKNP